MDGDLYEEFRDRLWDEALEAAWDKVAQDKDKLCVKCRIALDDDGDLP